MIPVKDVDSLEQEYLRYLETHTKGVRRTWYEILKPEVGSQFTEEQIDFIEGALDSHDLSKYDDAEFDAYRKWWYPVDEDDKDEKAYDLAWLHHQKNNPHHPQYWILIKDSGRNLCLDMPLEHIIEMLCDWHSFTQRDPESTAYKWYSESKDNIQLSDATREIVEKYIEYLKEPLK